MTRFATMAEDMESMLSISSTQGILSDAKQQRLRVQGDTAKRVAVVSIF